MLAWLIPAILLALGIALQVYLYLLPYLHRKSEARNQADSQMQGNRSKVKEALTEYSFLPSEESYRLWLYIDNALIPRAKRKRLKHIKQECMDYSKWLEDVSDFISFKIDEEVTRREDLKFKWECLVKRGKLYAHFEDKLKTIVTKPIIDGTLDLATVKQAIVENYGPDCRASLEEFSPSDQEELRRIVGESFLKLNEHILGTTDFEKIVERLIRLQERPFIRKLKEIRDSCLDKIEREVK